MRPGPRPGLARGRTVASRLAVAKDRLRAMLRSWYGEVDEPATLAGIAAAGAE